MFNLLTFLILVAISCQISTSFLLYIGWHSTNQQKKKELILCDFPPFPHIQSFENQYSSRGGDVGGSAKKLEKELKNWRESIVSDLEAVIHPDLL